MEHSILPGEGFGRLRFGMPFEDVKVVSSTYGTLVAAPSAKGIGNFTQEEIDSYREMLSEEQLRELIEAAQSYESEISQREEFFIQESSIKLVFEVDALTELQISRGSLLLEYQRHFFFNANPRLFLAALQEANREPPLIKGPDCVFKNIYVYVWAAFEVLPSGVVKFFTEADIDDLAQDKSIILRADPRNPDEDFSDYTAISFIR